MDPKTAARFARLEMLYATLWGYLDHFASSERWSEIEPFKKSEVLTVAKEHHSNVASDRDMGSDLRFRVDRDFNDFHDFVGRIDKALGSETIKDSKLRGRARRFCLYLQAESQRYGELAGEL